MVQLSISYRVFPLGGLVCLKRKNFRRCRGEAASKITQTASLAHVPTPEKDLRNPGEG